MKILIKNGLVIDGTGAAGFKADVLVDGDTIIAVGDLQNVHAERTIDARDRVISPGFIDMHSHADVSLPIFPTADSLMHQGITTIVPGNCGLSPAPLAEFSREEFMATINSDDLPKLPDQEWSTFGEFLDYLEKIGVSPNVIPLVGQGAVRAAVMGFSSDRPTEEQMETMQNIVEQSMSEGAAGMSTGLIYPPGSYATTDELAEVSKPLGEKGGIYFSHIRGEGDTLLEALQEAVEIGRRSNSQVHISHYKAAGAENWDKAQAGLDILDNGRAEGVKISADMYPYVAGSTSLVAVLPEWAQEGGYQAIFERLTNEETRGKMIASMKNEGFFKVAEWDKVFISESKNPDYTGKTIAFLAEKADKDPYTFIFDALLETKGQMGMVLFMMSEENVKMQLKYPFMMIGTDGAGMPFEGEYAKGVPHPRSFGTYPRVLGKYVREEKILSLEEAIWKMTGLPAQTLGLNDRGVIKAQNKADLVIFDPEKIIDTADFANPYQKPAGIDYVMVNGTIVVEHNNHTMATPGVVIRKIH